MAVGAKKNNFIVLLGNDWLGLVVAFPRIRSKPHLIHSWLYLVGKKIKGRIAVVKPHPFEYHKS